MTTDPRPRAIPYHHPPAAGLDTGLGQVRRSPAPASPGRAVWLPAALRCVRPDLHEEAGPNPGDQGHERSPPWEHHATGPMRTGHRPPGGREEEAR
eukprot:12915558-Alexandrium_andersonii.AAC.1